jgi:hypothetical protein
VSGLRTGVLALRRRHWRPVGRLTRLDRAFFFVPFVRFVAVIVLVPWPRIDALPSPVNHGKGHEEHEEHERCILVERGTSAGRPGAPL